MLRAYARKQPPIEIASQPQSAAIILLKIFFGNILDTPYTLMDLAGMAAGFIWY